MADPGFYVASGLSGLLQGYMQGRDSSRKADIENQKLALLKQGQQDEHIKRLAEAFSTGTQYDPESDSISFRPSYIDSTSDEAKGFNRQAELKHMASAKFGGTPSLTAGDIADYREYQKTGGKGMDPNAVSRIRALQIPSGYSNMMQPSERPIQGSDAEQLRALGLPVPKGVVGTVPNAVLPYIPNIKPNAGVPETIRAQHDALFGSNSTIGLKPEEAFKNIQDEKKRLAEVAKARATTEAAAAKASAAKESRNKYANVVTQDIDRALGAMNASPNAVGPYVGQLKVVPGTAAYNLNNILDSIKANISFDRLQEMRNASPTGGALGQVSDMENRLLQSTLGKLEVSTDPKDFEYNLRRLKHQYLEVINGPGTAGPQPEPPISGEPEAKAGPSLKDSFANFFGGGPNASDQRAEGAKKKFTAVGNPSDRRAGIPVGGAIMPQKTIDEIKRFPDKGTQAAPKIGATKIVGGITYKRTRLGWEEQ